MPRVSVPVFVFCIRMCASFSWRRFLSLACVWPRAIYLHAANRRVRLVAGRDDAESALGALRNAALQVRRYSRLQPLALLCCLCARVSRLWTRAPLPVLLSVRSAAAAADSAQPGEYGVDPPAARGRLEHSALGGQRPRPRRHRRVRLGLLRRDPRTRPEYARLSHRTRTASRFVSILVHIHSYTVSNAPTVVLLFK